MGFNAGGYYPQNSIIGTLVFPGRTSSLPAHTVPEYPAQAYPVLNFSKGANEMNLALGDGGYPMYNQNSYTGYSQPRSNYSSYSPSSYNFSPSNYGSSNFGSNFDYSNSLSMFDPAPISDLYGNQIPFNNCLIQEGLFGNFHGTQSILSRYVGDTMPTDKDAPGYTWKYTLPGFGSSSTASTATASATATATAAKTTATASATATATASSTANNGSDNLSYFNPRPISDLYGNQIPFNNCLIQEGLFGNVHGVNSILSRYVADTMPTDKDAPGYTWKYTVPGG